MRYAWPWLLLHLVSTGHMAASRTHVKSQVQRERDILGVSPLLHIQSVLGSRRQAEGLTAEIGSCLKLCTSRKLQVLVAPGSQWRSIQYGGEATGSGNYGESLGSGG